ncbi:MAG: hypothetical protein HQL09_02900 [Nitrospirae bacterium]|nr:hypothetical protein [Nitrospirota bacterium]
MKHCRLLSKFREGITAQEGIEISTRKQDEIDEQKAYRQAIEDNIRKVEQTKALKEAEREAIFIQSSIYDALKKGNKIKKGDKISVVRRTSPKPGSLVIITEDSKQELISFLERSCLHDFRIKDELTELDKSKDWVEVNDEIAWEKYYIVSKH